LVFKIFGLGPIARPSPPRILTRMTQVWVSQTNPAHSLLAHSPLSFSRAPPATDVTAAVACRSRPSPVTSAADTWAYDAPLGPLPPPPSGLELLASPMRLGVDLRSGSRQLLSPPSSHPTGSPLCACCACLRWSRCVCITGESTECGAPGGVVVKSSPGSLWPATRALPRHAVQTCAWAYGERVPLLLPLSSLLRPWLLAIWP
jgi:hypothetical protein